MKYNRKQIQESIKHWKKVLESIDENDGNAVASANALISMAKADSSLKNLVSTIIENETLEEGEKLNVVKLLGVLALGISMLTGCSEKMSDVAEATEWAMRDNSSTVQVQLKKIDDALKALQMVVQDELQEWHDAGGAKANAAQQKHTSDTLQAVGKAKKKLLAKQAKLVDIEFERVMAEK